MATRPTPKKILPLPKEVVDRIAAGEVVQRPVSVVKELIENSLDADGTQIDIQIQRGGLDSIIVTDNGIGISPRDLPLACTRFATSKLVHVDDLKSIKSFGFRGEALASASMVGRVGIVSRIRPRIDGGGDTNDDDDDTTHHNNCAYKMSYRDGAPNPQTNPNNKPTPSAGKDGTSITVQDLFYNIPSRRRAFEGGRSEREEYDKILDVVQRYAVHVAKKGVGFICRGGSGNSVGGAKGKKGSFGGGNRTDLNTQSLASVKRLQEKRKMAWQNNSIAAYSNEEQFAATKDVIGHIFGSDITRELLPLSAGEGDVEAVSLVALKAMVPTNANDGSSPGMDEGQCRDHADNENGASNSISMDSHNSLLEEMMIGATDDVHTSKSDDVAGTDSQTSNTKVSKFAFAYRATGLVTNGSYSTPKSSSGFLLFINDRLVESTSMRRAVESVYSDTLPKGGKPFVYLSLELPGPHVDVNVHPTKREVAFLHEDRLCDAVSRAVRGVIGSATVSRTFTVANGGRLLAKEESDRRGEGRSKLLQTQVQAVVGAEEATIGEESMVEKENRASICSTNTEDTNGDADEPKALSFDGIKSKNQTPMKREPPGDLTKDASSTQRSYDPSRLVRTNRSLPVGALEPYLVQKDMKGKGAGADDAVPAGVMSNLSRNAISHKPGCPSANDPSGQQVDMSLPGAFALAICRCQVERSETLPPAPNGFVVRNDINASIIVRPKKITPTQCDYESIINLRADIANINHQGLNETLRGSTYVGAISRSRSLIQHGINLLMINHRDLASEMFYQIALLKFKGMPMAELGGGGVDVAAAIGQMLQFEEDLSSTSATAGTAISIARVNKTNADLAKQATTCLAEKAAMLEEYFSIKLEMINVDGNRQNRHSASLYLTGLPILLDGHSPQPHALPLFLLRLATEVDWTEEAPCFEGVCCELASFYSELPFKSSADESSVTGTKIDKRDKVNDDDLIDEEAKKYVKHTLFPAVSFLLVPPKRFADNGCFVKLADLNSLYKVFERC